MDVVSGIAAATQAIGFARELSKIDRAVDEASYKLKIAELTSVLSDLKLALVDAHEDVRAKEKVIETLKEGLAFRDGSTLLFQGQRYLKNSKGEPKGTPFCAKCEGETGRYIHIVQGLSSMSCPTCKSNFGTHIRTFSWDD